jgi:hemoglobin
MHPVMSRLSPCLSALALASLLVACAPSAPPQPRVAAAPAVDPASLYARLGQKPAITAVVDDFVANVAADKRINRYFAHTDIPALKAKLVDQICMASGGPCTYTGSSMKEAHKGMGIRTRDFNALVADLKKSLDKFNVPAKEQSELLGALGPMKNDIVEHS